MDGEITGELIKSAIAKRIKNTLLNTEDNTTKIYKEQIVQNFKTPSFFIWTVSVEQQKLTRRLFARTYIMEIRYHAAEHDPKLYETLSEMGNKLSYYLTRVFVPILLPNEAGELVLHDLPVFGNNIEFKITDDVLILNVNFNVKMYPELVDKIYMQELTIQNKLKEDL